jgi:NAD(P)-dependent dehydrogenase (short-subunit alcohol dehydrogenase family)
MLDSNGCNTTSAAAVARITGLGSVAGKKAVVFAGTGPVGQRGAVLLALEGANVTLTSRKLDRAEAACASMAERFGVSLTPLQVSDAESTRAALDGAQIILAAGAAGIELVPAAMWQDSSTLEVLADINTVPPLGIGGLEMMDKGEMRHGKKCLGGLGIGNLKMKVHRAAIAKLFEANNQVFDAREIYLLARELA